jgi:predicted choloylglycine hydrolase
MGQKMGAIFKQANAQFPIKLDSFQKKYGKESGKLLKKYFPEAAEEIRGITDTIGYDNELFTSWMMCMGCCLYTSDVESVEVRGCTAFAFTAKGQIIYGRTNDLPPFFKQVSKSVFYQPENGNRFLLNTSSFINGEEGINEHGLAAAMTFVMPKVEEIQPGINSIFLVRYILEKCRSVDEGLAVLKTLPVSSSCNILLADKSEKMLVAECNPFELTVRKPLRNNNSESFIITVNHFTSRKMRKHEAGNHNEFQSAERYETAYTALMNTGDKGGVTYAQKILSGKCGFMCQYEKSLNFETIWASVFDITNNKIYRAEGNPQKTKLIEDKRLTGE